jgi:hypothetical protein
MKTYPASEQESQLAASAFTKYRHYQNECACCLDAEIDAAVSVSGWFSNHTAQLSGYLQAMEPGFIKFVALNPLGQPILILLTNGEIFKSLNVSEGRAYSGSVKSETFKKFVPPGFDPEFSYYLLTGKLPPENIKILEVRLDREQNGYWLQVHYGQWDVDNMILFDPEKFIILRHIVMSDEGDQLLDLVYEEYMTEKQLAGNDPEMVDSNDSGKKICRVPTKISISSNTGAEKKINLTLSSFLRDADFSHDDFKLKIPDNFEQLIVK